MKQIIITIFLISFFLFPQAVFAQSRETKLDELNDKIIDLLLQVSSLQKQIEEIIYSSPPFEQQNLGDYLKSLFESNGIFLEKDDFFEEVGDPNLSFAKILNLIPESYNSSQKISQKRAKIISDKFLSVKNKILLDGLYGKIDFHEHYRADGNIVNFLEAAAQAGISKALFLPTGMSPDGGEGLKILGGHPDFYDEPLDSENMYKVYEVARKYDAPILLHASIINIPELKVQLHKIYSNFPETTFIQAHYCSAIFQGINLDQCAEFLDEHPNLFVDLSMGGGIQRYHRYLRQDLTKVKDFVLKYQDRILFGSDIILDSASYKNSDWIQERILCDLDLHQKEEYRCSFGEKDALKGGFNLERGVLKKLYYDNPKKALGF